HDDLGGGNAFLGVDAHRNPAPVIGPADRAVGIEFDQHQVAMPRQCLVNRIVGYLEHHVVQAAAVVGIAYIHAWTLAYGIQPLEDLDRIGAIIAGSMAGVWSVGHAHHIGTHGG